jgi:PRTRC genetic system protein A
VPDADLRDRIILEHAPLVAMPRFGELADLAMNRHRFLAGDDGLYLELRRSWAWVVALVAPSDMPLPYGNVPELYDYRFDETMLEALLEQFVEDARLALPNECAAWGVWNEHTELLEYRPLIADSASPGSVTFHRPRLESHEHLAVDIHSHADGHAFFSLTDDEDDRGEVKLSIVAGTVDKEPTFVSRLCALGFFLDSDEQNGTLEAG